MIYISPDEAQPAQAETQKQSGPSLRSTERLQNLFCVNLCAYWWISVPRASTDQGSVNTFLETASRPAAQGFIWKTLCWLLTCVLTYNILFHGEIQMQLWF